jgi:hypothetical protein
MDLFVSQVLKKYRLHFLLFTLVFVVNLFYNGLNISVLSGLKEGRVREGVSVVTNDDLTYIRPAINLIDNFEFKDGTIGIQKYFYRPPGYALFFSFFYLLFGLKYGLLTLVLTQSVLHSLSFVLLFNLSIKQLSIKSNYSLIFFSIFGCIPFTGNFSFYTLTEGITPFLVVVFFYSLFSNRYIDKPLIVSILALLFIMLIRPVFIFLFIPFLYKIWVETIKIKLRIKKMILYTLLVLLPLFLWQIRAITIAGEYPGVYPIYYKTANNIYRKSHESIWNFAKSWGVKGDDFHEAIGEIWSNQIKSDTITDEENTQKFFDLIPTYVYGVIKKEDIFKALILYKKSIIQQKKYFDLDLPIPKNGLKYEVETINRFRNFKYAFQRNFTFEYFVVSPFKYLKAMIFHSNISLYIFQHTYRGNIFLECVRLLCLLIHVFLFFLFFFSAFKCNSRTIKMVSISVLGYILFLAFYYRELEERYTLPILLIGVYISFYYMSNLVDLFKSTKKINNG